MGSGGIGGATSWGDIVGDSRWRILYSNTCTTGDTIDTNICSDYATDGAHGFPSASGYGWGVSPPKPYNCSTLISGKVTILFGGINSTYVRGSVTSSMEQSDWGC